MSLAPDTPPEPDFFLEGGPNVYRTYDFYPSTPRDGGGYQLSMWLDPDHEKGNVFKVKKRRPRDSFAFRVMQPNYNGFLWKMIADGKVHFESYDSLLKMGERQRAMVEKFKE